MKPDEVSGYPGMLLGYARAGTAAHTLESQIDALTDAGVEPARIYSDVFAAITRMQRRPGFTALLDYARPGDITVVVGIDRLGRSAPEVMATARDLTERQIGLRSLREGLPRSLVVMLTFNLVKKSFTVRSSLVIFMSCRCPKVQKT